MRGCSEATRDIEKYDSLMIDSLLDLIIIGGTNISMQHFLLDEEGQTLVEYGLLISLVALVIIPIVQILGSRLRSGYSASTASLATST